MSQDSFITRVKKLKKIFKVKKNQNKNTLRKTLFDVKLFSCFLRSKNDKRKLYKTSPTELDVFLANFILGVWTKGERRLNGVTKKNDFQ